MLNTCHTTIYPAWVCSIDQVRVRGGRLSITAAYLESGTSGKAHLLRLIAVRIKPVKVPTVSVVDDALNVEEEKKVRGGESEGNGDVVLASEGHLASNPSSELAQRHEGGR